MKSDVVFALITIEADSAPTQVTISGINVCISVAVIPAAQVHQMRDT